MFSWEASVVYKVH